jgi:hypothetical protein
MKAITALLALTALAITATAADVVRLEKGAIAERLTLPAGIGAASVSAPGRLTADLIAAGWRDYAPATITGSVKSATWTDTGARWVESVTYYSAAELAAQAVEAAEAQAKAAAEQAAKDAETKALEDAQKAAIEKAKTGITGKIEDRVANLETILGLRQ